MGVRFSAVFYILYCGCALGSLTGFVGSQIRHQERKHPFDFFSGMTVGVVFVAKHMKHELLTNREKE